MFADLLDVYARVELALDGAPWWLRLAVGVVGIVLATRGASMKRDAIRFSAILAGALGTTAWLSTDMGAEVAWSPRAFAGSVVLGAAVLLWTERLLGIRAALAVVGLVAGAAYGVSVREAFSLAEASPHGAGWVPLITSLICAGVLPWIFETMPRIWTPAVGAVGVAWALGGVGFLPALIGLWGLGTTVQWFSGPADLDAYHDPSAPPPEPMR